MNWSNKPSTRERERDVPVDLAMVLLTIVFALGKLSESGYIGLIGLIVGYLVGNGIAARSGDTVIPAIGPKED